MERRYCAQRIHLENRAVRAAHAADIRRPIEVSVSCLRQAAFWKEPVAARKRMKRRQHAVRCHFKNRSSTSVSASESRSTIKIAILSLYEGVFRPISIRASRPWRPAIK